MSAYQIIEGVILTTLPGAQVETGFGKSLDEFLGRTALASDVAAFITLSLAEPKQKRQSNGGGFIDRYTIYLRARANPTDVMKGYHDLYLPLRSALDGKEFQDANSEWFTISVDTCAPLYDKGYDAFAIDAVVE
ncbi:MAG: hypothetical protein ABIR47_07430 [Candidatus Kapaibacterium sp.]